MEDHANKIAPIDPTLAAAFVAFQAELTPVPKSADNPFFRSKYADFGAVQRHVGPLLAKHKLSIMQPVRTANDKTLIVTRLLHESGAYIEEVSEVAQHKADAQGKGSAITYERRYAYMAITGAVAEDEDDDGNAASQRSEQPAAHTAPQSDAPASDKQKALIAEKLEQAGVTKADMPGYLMEMYGVQTPLTKEGASFVIEQLIGGSR